MIATKRKVTIVILNWNELHHTLPCLESVAALTYPSIEVIVVDNGSVDDSVDTIRRKHPEARLLTTSENLGFTGGNNMGIRAALAGDAEYLLLLNNDTTIAADAVDHLVDAVESNPDVGVAGPMIYYSDSPDCIWSAGGTLDWRHGEGAMNGLNEKDCGQYGTSPRYVDFVTGCAMLIKRDILERIGPLDDRFFIYFEEVEWCVRASKAGARIVHVPLAKVWHKISLEKREASPRVHYYMTRNRLLFLHCAGAGMATWAQVAFDYTRTLASWSLRPRWRHKRAQRDIMLRAITDFLRGRFGRAELFSN